MKYLNSFSIFLVVASFLLLGCGSEAPKETKPGPEKVIVVGSQWYGHIPVWVGIEKGIFKEAGFDVKWLVIGKSMDRLNAISSGEAQFASLGEIAMLSAMAHGNHYFYWVGNQDIAPGFEGLVGGKGIKKFSDLKGKSIGFPFGSSVDLTCRLLLKEHGLDPNRDVKLVNLEVGDVPAAFLAGNIDAALVWEPGFSKLLTNKDATVLGMDTDTEIYKKFGTMTGPDVLILGKKWTDENPERAKKFMAAYFKALDFVANNPDKSVEIIHGKYIQQDKDLISNNLKKFVWYGLEDQKKVMSDEGILGQAEHIVDILHKDIRTIPERPAFREWVNIDILPFKKEKK